MKHKIERISNDLIVLHIPHDVTDEGIDQMTKECIPVVVARQEGFCCAIAGYDKDDRELYQIPEVTKLCQRLVDRGLISILTTSTLMEKEQKPWYGGFFGALEIWSIAKGYLTPKGDLEIEPQMFETFIEVLTHANAVAKRLEIKVKDGTHRTTAKW